MKKSGLLKIVHEKYRVSPSVLGKSEEAREFQRMIQGVAEENKELKPFLGKAQENLTPLRVLQLFIRIPDEVGGERGEERREW